jgi:hypothetical protein
MLLDDQHIIEEIREKIKILIESKENENPAYQNVWDEAKAVLTWKVF